MCSYKASCSIFSLIVSGVLLTSPPVWGAGLPSDQNAVETWDRIATEAAGAIGLTNLPTVEARLYAMSSLAQHDALNAIDRRYRSYAIRAKGLPDASVEAAVATAAHEVLVDQFGRLVGLLGLPSQQSFLDSAYAEALAQIPDGTSKSAGVFIGSAAASAILAVRAADGLESQTYQDFNYPQGTKPGEYRFTEGTPFAFSPDWGEMPPFALRSGRQFRPAPPYNLRSRRYADDVNEIQALGGNGTTTPSARTADETQIALFWFESSPTQWNRIARALSANHKLDAWKSARLFALLNVALADGYISSFNAKYYFKFWRPETAIRHADEDGNAATIADPGWTPLMQTPPIPDYDSAHAVEGGAAAQVFRRFFRTDRMNFFTCSTSLPAGQTCTDAGVVYRSYDRFSDAAAENGLSRILVGIHFRHAVDEGLEHGTKVGEWAFDHILRPARRADGSQDASAETPDTAN